VLCQVGSPLETVVETAGHPMLLTTGFPSNLQQVFLANEGQITSVPGLLSGTDKALKAHNMFNMAWLIIQLLSTCGSSCGKLCVTFRTQ
jgi:hypothetical protein